MCGAIGFEFSDARAVELKSADRGTKIYCGEIHQAAHAHLHEIEYVERFGFEFSDARAVKLKCADRVLLMRRFDLRW